jgi:hypothetical protein
LGTEIRISLIPSFTVQSYIVDNRADFTGYKP